MAQQNRTTLKSYFETGDIPTEAQFINLIDSLLNISDDTTFQFDGQATGGTNVESFSATASFNLNNGNSQEMVLSGNVTSLALTNKVNGGSYLIWLIQDAAGSRTIPTPGSSFGQPTDNSASFSEDADAENLINVNVSASGRTRYTVETYTS